MLLCFIKEIDYPPTKYIKIAERCGFKCMPTSEKFVLLRCNEKNYKVPKDKIRITGTAANQRTRPNHGVLTISSGDTRLGLFLVCGKSVTGKSITAGGYICSRTKDSSP